MPGIHTSDYSIKIDFKAYPYRGTDDGMPCSVSLVGEDEMHRSSVQLSGMTPALAESIAASLLDAAAACRRIDAAEGRGDDLVDSD